ncbi:pleckstrin homology domain-containing family F member 2-like [Aulostomus maculatus]
MDMLTFKKENLKRIRAVENSFGLSGGPLRKEGRVLIGEGPLKKQGRRKSQTKAFFLFNDILVYGTILLNGHLHNSQKIIPLEDIHLEDMEDSVRMKNQWLICTPRKSFAVAANSPGEKQAWMEHIKDCRCSQLKGSTRLPVSIFAASWIPNSVAYRCMRCISKFTLTNRRHHCRKCGFLVCNSCSKQRAVIRNIDTKKELRVCHHCHTGIEKEKISNSVENNAESSANEEVWEMHFQSPSKWLDKRTSTYVSMTPAYQRHQ